MFKKCPRSVTYFRTEHLGGKIWDSWSPYVADLASISAPCWLHFGPPNHSKLVCRDFWIPKLERLDVPLALVDPEKDQLVKFNVSKFKIPPRRYV